MSGTDPAGVDAVTCDLCTGAEDETARCGDKHPEKFKFCTRPVGHDGDHAACGTQDHEHPVERWSQ